VVDLASLGANLTPRLMLTALVSAASTATFRLYLAATSPGDTTGGTVRATATTVSTTMAQVAAAGAAFANPGGQVLVQVTGQNSSPATAVSQAGSFSLSLT